MIWLRSLTYITTIASLGFCLAAIPQAYAQIFPLTDHPIIVETEEGMVLIGEVANEEDLKSQEQSSLVLDTSYGELDIPFSTIKRIDGDRFDVEKGIIREHHITLHRDGSAVLDYILPVPTQDHQKQITLLAAGKVLQISTLDGKTLHYMAKEFGNYTRCTVDLPDTLTPALQLRVIQKQAATVQENLMHYRYRYTPRSHQHFQLNVSLPANTSILQATPETIERATDSIRWELPLQRQIGQEFSLSLRLE